MNAEETDSIEWNGVFYAKGTKVRLNLSSRRADILDTVINGKLATVERIYRDYESRIYLAVTLDDDPLGNLAKQIGQPRYLFFFPDEVILVSPGEKIRKDRGSISLRSHLQSEEDNKASRPQKRQIEARAEEEHSNGRILIACVGNVLMGDDGFGVEVAKVLISEKLPMGVEVIDFGIGGMNIVYELMSGYNTLIIVDSIMRRSPAGSLFVLEPEIDEYESIQEINGGHEMNPSSVLRLALSYGILPEKVVLIGCEPRNCDEGIGLSDEVRASVSKAVDIIRSFSQ